MKPILKSVATVHGMSGKASVNHSREAHIQQAPKHPPKMFWGFFTVFGPGSFIPIERMNSDKYKDILANYLLPILSDSDSRAERVFKQNLAPCHISKNANLFCADRYNPVRLAREQFSILYAWNLHNFNLSKI